MSLYQAAFTEIAHVAESAKRRHPALGSRIDKAAELLLSGGLQIEPVAWQKGQDVRWRVASQSHAGSYIIVGLSCPCEDCRSNRAAYCKHAIAVALYVKILNNKLNAGICNFDVELGVLDNGQFSVYARGMGYAQAAKLGRHSEICTFINHASAVHYSLWLAKREAVRLPVAMPALTALAA